MRTARTVAAAALMSAALVAAAGACKVQIDSGGGSGASEGSAATSGQAAPAVPAGQIRFVHAAAGDVAPLVRDAMAREAAQKRRLVVYVGATWCEPCQRFHKAAEHGDLDATFPDLTLLEFDQDADGDRLKAAGYVSRLIPLFALPSADGTSSGKQAEGGVKGERAVGVIVPKLRDLLAGSP